MQIATDAFRFETKQEYEDTISNILLAPKKEKNRLRSDVTSQDDEEYEELLEEYLRFCSKN